ncbi:Uncharacterized protein ToN1_10150 [Aromatoleum petrolei]|nr:Uncharacterized protein ToN1_10150 [Aromatoleum petrolei]
MEPERTPFESDHRNTARRTRHARISGLFQALARLPKQMGQDLANTHYFAKCGTRHG